MQNPICYIFGAGEHYGPPPVPVSGDLVIAADGGLTYLEQHGLTPHLLVGDFDSLTKKPSSELKTVVLPKVKDDTDMVAALREGKNRGYRVFHIYGGTGGRLDHTLANIQCIADLAQNGCKGCLFDRDTVITAIHNDKINFPASAHGVVSAFAHTETCTDVYERGLKYPLTDASLYNTYPLGVSNEFTGVNSEISVREGTLIVIYPKDIKISF
ncbi:MAG TPA: thiamine diphosphokinase [Oscillospiraceae bacterium]|nr:thiamine diphosphokinase [Oscillospiraceae bacterium]HPF55014.1 thiamine diphosphokinase [Clostridiales bacterium]HPK35918.1 thiamine diphosphokinase [Oscillospiraceae bacterium]HPR75612.1 thiamine diphosphokinase [Oscillospiraceae bacterium]